MTIETDEKIMRPCGGKSSLHDCSSPRYFGIMSAIKQFILFGSSIKAASAFKRTVQFGATNVLLSLKSNQAKPK